MSFLFGGGKSASEPSTPPSTSSVSRDRITSALKSRSGMRGRAAALLTRGNQAPETAKRQVMGN